MKKKLPFKKIRNTWDINPVTRIHKSKKKYNRKKEKAALKRILSEENNENE